MANPALKYSYQPRTPEEIPTMVKQGFYIAETGRPGPVLLDIPKDVQQNEGKFTFPDEVRVPGYHPWADPDIANTARAVELLLSAKKTNNTCWWWCDYLFSICRITIHS